MLSRAFEESGCHLSWWSKCGEAEPLPCWSGGIYELVMYLCQATGGGSWQRSSSLKYAYLATSSRSARGPVFFVCTPCFIAHHQPELCIHHKKHECPCLTWVSPNVSSRNAIWHISVFISHFTLLMLFDIWNESGTVHPYGFKLRSHQRRICNGDDWFIGCPQRCATYIETPVWWTWNKTRQEIPLSIPKWAI